MSLHRKDFSLCQRTVWERKNAKTGAEFELLSKFWKAGELELVVYHGKCFPAKKFLHMLEHCRFVGYEKDSAYFKDALSLLVEVCSKQFLRLDSDIDTS